MVQLPEAMLIRAMKLLMVESRLRMGVTSARTSLAN